MVGYYQSTVVTFDNIINQSLRSLNYCPWLKQTWWPILCLRQQTMPHIVNKCPLTRSPGGLRVLQAAGIDSIISWLHKLSICYMKINITDCTYFSSFLICSMAAWVWATSFDIYDRQLIPRIHFISFHYIPTYRQTLTQVTWHMPIVTGTVTSTAYNNSKLLLLVKTFDKTINHFLLPTFHHMHSQLLHFLPICYMR